MKTKIRSITDLTNRKKAILEEEDGLLDDMGLQLGKIKDALPIIGKSNKRSRNGDDNDSILSMINPASGGSLLTSIIPVASFAMTNIAKHLPVKGRFKTVLTYLPLLLNFLLPLFKKK